MKISKPARRQAKALFRSCVVAGLLDEGRVRGAVQRVLDLRPRGYLAVLSHFQRLVKLDVERRTARVESPMALGADLQTRLQSDLARLHGPGLQVSFAQNPALIGGLRVKVGSDVYDGSVRARLAALEESF
jgi:F-type H+-transporting ATPase subunit delta